jgi:pimeloyl-ACP methyl ester carboxylesterase
MAVLPHPGVVRVETAHGDVRVVDTGGGGSPVLLVHSLLVDPDLYAPLVPLLASRGYRCIVPELPFGAHAVPAAADADLTPPGLAMLLVEVLDALGVRDVDVVGVDTGGALAQLLMADHRDRVRRVVLTACDAYDAFPPQHLGRLFAPVRSRPGLWAAAQLGRSSVVRRLVNVAPLTHRGVDAATIRRWMAPLRDPLVRRDLTKVMDGMHPRHTLRAGEENRTFPRAVLVAWGDDDRVFPRRLAERLAADLPVVRLVTLPDCGAFASIDQPDLLAALIDEHLGSVPAPAPG